MRHGYCALVPPSPTEVVAGPIHAPRPTWLRRYGYDVIWGAVVCLLVLAAFVVPHLHLGWLTPVVHQSAGMYRVLGGTAPLLGKWMPHANAATVGALVLAVTVVGWGPSVAGRLAWRGLVALAWLSAFAWTMALTLIDGWKRGFVDRMVGFYEYRHDLRRVGGIHPYFQHFASHIPSPRPGAWDIESSAHPPLGLLTFVELHRIGLSGSAWASLLCVVAGTSAAAAVLITVKAISGEELARRVAPFVALAPAAVWIGVSADAFYTGVAAWGLTLLALASSGTGRFPTPLALAAGVLLGCAVYLNYGLILMAIPALAIMIACRNYRPVLAAGLGALVVATTVTALGFWWLDGLSLLRQRYLSTIAMDRPYAYWVWGDLAALTCAIGLPAAIALRRVFDGVRLRARTGLNVLLVSMVAAVVIADLSALSKAETERIWLPFAVWLVAAPALLPRRSHRTCLAVQAVGALAINSLLFTTW
jgi:methylthioxylose transferase